MMASTDQIEVEELRKLETICKSILDRDWTNKVGLNCFRTIEELKRKAVSTNIVGVQVELHPVLVGAAIGYKFKGWHPNRIP